VLDDRQLLVLVGRHETGERQDARDLRQLLQLGDDRPGRFEIGSENIDRVSFGAGAFLQIEQGCDGLGLFAAQVERIEVEVQMRKQRAPEQRDAERADYDGAPMLA
jgi:hypothetical protein